MNTDDYLANWQRTRDAFTRLAEASEELAEAEGGDVDTPKSKERADRLRREVLALCRRLGVKPRLVGSGHVGDSEGISEDMDNTPAKQIARKRYLDRLRAEGLCRGCRMPARPGRATCEPCAERDTKAQYERRRRRRKEK